MADSKEKVLNTESLQETEKSRSSRRSSRHSSKTSGRATSFSERIKDATKDNVYKKAATEGILFGFDIDSIIRDVIRQWWVILLFSLGAACFFGAYVKYTYVPKYSTSCTFIVSKNGISTGNAYDNVNAAKDLTENFSTIVDSDLLRRSVKSKLGIDEFRASVSCSTVENTNLMTLRVVAYSPEETWRIAKATMEIAAEFSENLEENMGIRILEEATIPTRVSNPLNTRRYMIMGFLGMGVFMVALFAFLSYMNDTVKNTKEFNYKVDGELLGDVPHERKFKTLRAFFKRKEFSLCIDNPMLSFGYVEAVRLMATRVRIALDTTGFIEKTDSEGNKYMAEDPSKTGGKILMVTSISENEGKSTIAANLALSLSQEGYRVCLMDCDFRKPSQYKVLDVPKSEVRGDMVVDLRSGKKLQDSPTGPNRSLTAYLSTEAHGRVLTREIEIRFSEHLAELKEKMDYIIVDTSPLGLVAEGERIATFVDACVLVVEQDLIEARFINDTLDQLAESKINVLGCIYNNVRTGIVSKFMYMGTYGTTYSSGYYSKSRYGRYGNYGRYGSYGSYGKYGSYGSYQHSYNDSELSEEDRENLTYLKNNRGED